MILFEIVKAGYAIYAIGKDEHYCQLLDFLDTIGSNLQKDGDAVLALLERAAQKGPPRNTEISHQIKDKIFEFVQGSLRVLWFYDEGKLILCTQGFIKKTQKTPSSEIEQATLIREKYFEEKKKGPFKIIKREKKVNQ
jgi:phage-related protein